MIEEESMWTNNAVLRNDAVGLTLNNVAAIVSPLNCLTTRDWLRNNRHALDNEYYIWGGALNLRDSETIVTELRLNFG